MAGAQFCGQCGHGLEAGVLFCGNCGARTTEEAAPLPAAPATLTTPVGALPDDSRVRPALPSLSSDRADPLESRSPAERRDGRTLPPLLAVGALAVIVVLLVAIALPLIGGGTGGVTAAADRFPEDVDAFVGINTDLTSEAWVSLAAHLDSFGAREDALEGRDEALRENFGRDTETIEDMLREMRGAGIGVVMNGLAEPDIVVVMESRDPQALLDLIVESEPGTSTTREASDPAVSVTTLRSGDAVTIHEGAVYLASSERALLGTIRDRRAGGSLADDDDFRDQMTRTGSDVLMATWVRPGSIANGADVMPDQQETIDLIEQATGARAQDIGFFGAVYSNGDGVGTELTVIGLGEGTEQDYVDVDALRGDLPPSTAIVAAGVGVPQAVEAALDWVSGAAWRGGGFLPADSYTMAFDAQYLLAELEFATGVSVRGSVLPNLTGPFAVAASEMDLDRGGAGRVAVTVGSNDPAELQASAARVINWVEQDVCGCSTDLELRPARDGLVFEWSARSSSGTIASGDRVAAALRRLPSDLVWLVIVDPAALGPDESDWDVSGWSVAMGTYRQSEGRGTLTLSYQRE